jgi:enoyl-[acyl-carrier protein] reductase I
MKNGGSLFTMTYYGSQAVVENYNIMGVAKAALESATRYIAAELGPKRIRVHAISPGPLATRAASGIPEFDALLEKAKVKAPSRALIDIDDVGAACAFLAHDAARLITGQETVRPQFPFLRQPPDTTRSPIARVAGISRCFRGL